MHRRTLLGLAATTPLLGLAACSTNFSSVPMPPPKLAGAWVPREAQLGGRDYALGNFNNALLEIDAQGGYQFGIDKGRITLLPSPTPPYKMDILGVQGPNAGRTILAIYAAEGEELTVCYQLARDGERPLELASPEKSAILLVRYKRKVPALG